MRNIIIFLLIICLWASLFWYHYVHNIKQLCINDAAIQLDGTESPTSILPQTEKKLLFQPNSYRLKNSDSIESLPVELLNAPSPNSILQIIGFYTAVEQTHFNFDLGEARAAEIKKLLLSHFSEEKIFIYSQLVDSFMIYQDSLIDAFSYEWIEKEQEELNIAEEDYFLLSHDSKRIKVEEFEGLISQIAERINTSQETIVIRGHTDSDGDSELNFKIALRNAKDVRDALLALGIDRQKIKTTGQGEENPIADNMTAKGRLENRRVEIELIE